MGTLSSTAYATTRRAVRRQMDRHPRLDLALGRALVSAESRALRLMRLDRRGAFSPEGGTFTCHGLEFAYRSEDASLATMVRLNGDYETAMRQAIASLLGAEGTFVDLGAHIGYFTLPAAEQVADRSHVFDFEPSPATFQTLVQNTSTNGYSSSVTTEQLAVSDRTHSLRFAIRSASEGNGVDHDGETEGVLEVQATSLDEYFRALGWPRVDVVKMDVEGQELAALRGMRELVARNPHIAVILEYNLNQIQEAGTGGQEIVDELTGMGLSEFTALFRRATKLQKDGAVAQLNRMGRRANINVLAQAPLI